MKTRIVKKAVRIAVEKAHITEMKIKMQNKMLMKMKVKIRSKK